MLACAVTAWFGVRRAFRPLTQIEDTAAAIAAGDLTRRIPARTARHRGQPPVRSLNAMLAQIEQSFAVREASEERMRQFVADASHELRTPLASVRGYAELFRQGAVSKPEDVADRHAPDRGRGRRGWAAWSRTCCCWPGWTTSARCELGPVDLTVLVGRRRPRTPGRSTPSRTVTVVGLDGELAPTIVQRRRRPAAPGPDQPRRQRDQPHPRRHADRDRRRQPRPPAGPSVQVRDHGPGVDPEKARRVFERFYRADPSRVRGKGGGNGLGLAIVAAIVAAHHGKVGVAPTPGGGATFVVDLPTANSQQPPSAV